MERAASSPWQTRTTRTTPNLNGSAFRLENRGGDAHTTRLRLSLPAGASCRVIQDGREVPLRRTNDPDYPHLSQLQMGSGPTRVEIIRDK